MSIDIEAIKPGDTVTVTVEAIPSNNRPAFTTIGETYQPSHSDGLWVGTVALASGFVTVTDHQPAPARERGCLADVTYDRATDPLERVTTRAIRGDGGWVPIDNLTDLIIDQIATDIQPLVTINPAKIDPRELQRIAEKAQDSEDMNWGDHDALAGMRAALAFIGIEAQ